jgi:hypothetical protein
LRYLRMPRRLAIRQIRFSRQVGRTGNAVVVLGRGRLPLYLWEQTQSGRRTMSEKCQQETHALQQRQRSFDELCGAFNAAVDLAAQRPEVDRLGQKPLGAIL